MHNELSQAFDKVWFQVSFQGDGPENPQKKSFDECISWRDSDVSCFDPLLAWWNKPGEELLAKPRILGNYRDLVHDDLRLFEYTGFPLRDFLRLRLIKLPCGKCEGCLMDRAQSWTFRNIVESLYHDRGCFLTLTVSDSILESVFPNGGLDHHGFQNFMKSLRKKHNVRYMMCGEYGENYHRPHYHCLLYGYDFPDKYFWKMHNDRPLFRSDELELIWPHGHAWIGALERRSIAYVCRYVLKKAGRSKDDGFAPEYVRMSLKPAIGAQWFHDVGLTDIYNHGEDGVFPNDFVFLDDRKIRPPRYYDKLYARSHSGDFVSLVNQRCNKAGDVFSVSIKDLEEAEEYFKCVTQGRIKKGEFNV